MAPDFVSHAIDRGIRAAMRPTCCARPIGQIHAVVRIALDHQLMAARGFKAVEAGHVKTGDRPRFSTQNLRAAILPKITTQPEDVSK